MELSYLSWAYTPVPLMSIQIQIQLEYRLAVIAHLSKHQR